MMLILVFFPAYFFMRGLPRSRWLLLFGLFIFVITFFSKDLLKIYNCHRNFHLNEDCKNAKNTTNFSFPGGMIFMITNGRHGNIIFQYAMLLSIKNLTNRPVYLVETLADGRDQISISDIFQNLSIPVLKSTDRRAEFVNCLPVQAEEDKIPIGYGQFAPNFINDITCTDVKIWGYFNSYKYFNSITDSLRKELTFKQQFVTYADTILHQVHKEMMGGGENVAVRFVGIHVRRGDFTLRSNHKIGYRVPDASYFRKAKSYLKGIYQERLLYVVATNDKQWARDHLSGPGTYISTSQSAASELALLAACNDTILSIGTFGWWAGFLSSGVTVYFKDFFAWGKGEDKSGAFVYPGWIPIGN